MSTTQTDLRSSTMVKTKRRQYPLPKLAKWPSEKTTLVSTTADFPVESADRPCRSAETAKQHSVSSSLNVVEHHRKPPLESRTESPTPLVRIGRVSLVERGRRALNKHTDRTARVAAAYLGTTPRQVRKARSGGLVALEALAKHVSVEEIITEARVKAGEAGFTDLAAGGDRKSDRQSEGLGIDLPPLGDGPRGGLPASVT